MPRRFEAASRKYTLCRGFAVPRARSRASPEARGERLHHVADRGAPSAMTSPRASGSSPATFWMAVTAGLPSPRSPGGRSSPGRRAHALAPPTRSRALVRDTLPRRRIWKARSLERPPHRRCGGAASMKRASAPASISLAALDAVRADAVAQHRARPIGSLGCGGERDPLSMSER